MPFPPSRGNKVQITFISEIKEPCICLLRGLPGLLTKQSKAFPKSLGIWISKTELSPKNISFYPFLPISNLYFIYMPPLVQQVASTAEAQNAMYSAWRLSKKVEILKHSVRCG